MANKATQLRLTDEQRKKLASDLGLEQKMDRVPDVIDIVKVSSKILPSVTAPIPQILLVR